jgi:hypothetical protein
MQQATSKTIIKRDEDRFQILEDEAGRPAILCKGCTRVSWHPQDVQHRYCGYCHEFLDSEI